MSQHIISLRTNFIVFVTLMILLVATVGFAYLDLGRWNAVIALLIASIKATLILLYFMHVRYSNRLTWVFASAAFLWLGILIALSLDDYLWRGWLDIPGK